MATNLDNILTPAVRKKYGELERLMCEQFGWKSAHKFQIDGTLLQLLGHDTIVHVGTGRGKTAVAAGPLVLPANAQKLSIVVSPLVALQEEMKVTFENTFKLQAMVINSNTTSSLSSILSEIRSGQVRIILVSPETLLSRRIVDGLLRDPTIAKTILSVIIDEAHCVSFWSDTFRKKYGALHIIRPFLPRNTPIVALSATLTPRVRRDIITRLNLSSSHLFINEGNDKSNLTVIAARCKFPLISLYDLAFIIPFLAFHPFDIPTTLVYADSIETGQRIVRFLTSLLPPHLQNAGIIRPYNARLTHEYRALAMKGLREGHIRVLVCTDAAGMGCDLPNIERVVQWRVVGLSSLIQRWGRSGRSGLKALGILLYEPSAENVNPTHSSSQPSQSAQSDSKPSKKRRKRPALLKGGFRSSVAGAEPDVQDDSPGEGVYALIQTNGCRRKIWNKVYGNEPVVLTVSCCDRCAPGVLEQIKTTKPPMKRGPRLPRKGSPFRPAQRKLAEWRDTVLKRDYRGVTWSSSAILPHNIIEILTSYGPIHSLELYEQLIRNKADETWWELYGEELGGVVLGLQIEYVPVAPKPKKSNKRAPDSVPEDSAKKRAKNSHASTTSDLAHPPAVVESDPTCSFRVHPQPPIVDAQSQPLQARPMLATFSLSSAPSSSRLDSASAPASTLPQTQSSVPGSSVPPAPVYQQSRPTYPQATDPPSYPHQTYPHHAYPQHVYPQHAYSRYHPYPYPPYPHPPYPQPPYPQPPYPDHAYPHYTYPHHANPNPTHPDPVYSNPAYSYPTTSHHTDSYPLDQHNSPETMRLCPTIPAPTHVYSQAQTLQLDAQQGQFLQDPSGQPRKTNAQTPVYQVPAGLTQREDTALHAPSTGIWGVNQQPLFQIASHTSVAPTGAPTSTSRRTRRTRVSHPELVQPQQTGGGYYSSFRAHSSRR